MRLDHVFLFASALLQRLMLVQQGAAVVVALQQVIVVVGPLQRTRVSTELSAMLENRRAFLGKATTTTAATVVRTSMMTTTPYRPVASSSLSALLLSTLSLLGYPKAAESAVESSSSLTDLLVLVKEARVQLNRIPQLIETEKWDSVRAVLIQPPLSDCWTKTARPILSQYAEAIGNSNRDELAALETKEEIYSHLRYLDMAVYNNNFNPIKSEGTNGASKELVRSYYEDPMTEWKCSVKALDDLIQLAEDI